MLSHCSYAALVNLPLQSCLPLMRKCLENDGIWYDKGFLKFELLDYVCRIYFIRGLLHGGAAYALRTFNPLLRLFPFSFYLPQVNRSLTERVQKY